jgi:hypothetical protein
VPTTERLTGKPVGSVSKYNPLRGLYHALDLADVFGTARIEQDLIPSLTADDLAFDLMPMTNHDAPLSSGSKWTTLPGSCKYAARTANPQARRMSGSSASGWNQGIWRVDESQ